LAAAETAAGSERGRRRLRRAATIVVAVAAAVMAGREVMGRDQPPSVPLINGRRPVTTLRKKIEPEPERPRYLVALRELAIGWMTKA
jgi:hypothetical protein